jgi:hypothetical protein
MCADHPAFATAIAGEGGPELEETTGGEHWMNSTISVQA